MIEPSIVPIIGIIFVIMMLNLYFFAYKRAKRSGNRRGKGRNYVPPDEAKQAAWRDREIARRIAREQDDAFERVQLKNETLALYETVRQRHAKKETLERLGIEADEDALDEMTSLGLEEYLSGDK